MKVILENIRTFVGRYEIEIAPITIIVGENSAGKSTLLAATAITGDAKNFPLNPNFNLQPYELGNFNTIISNSREANKEFFSLGFSKGNRRKSKYQTLATYKDSKGIAEIYEIKIDRQESILNIARVGKDLAVSGKTASGKEFERKFKDKSDDLNKLFNLDNLIFSIVQHFIDELAPESFAEEGREFVQDFVSSFYGPSDSLPRSQISLSPIRSKPKRTYDEFRDDFSPDGDHIPFVLSSLLSDPEKKDFISKSLKQFGKDSGLFDDIRIKRLGKSASDPFQILVKSKGKEVNITDVGYGVSQALPIIVECVTAGKGTRVLMQQPEVHLHPKAQAALGSFIASMKKSSDQYYMIETHSDFLIDRILLESRQGIINHKDISILFLEKEKGKTVVHTLKVNGSGEIIDPPDSYKKFFLEEQFRILGVM